MIYIFEELVMLTLYISKYSGLSTEIIEIYPVQLIKSVCEMSTLD